MEVVQVVQEFYLRNRRCQVLEIQCMEFNRLGPPLHHLELRRKIIILNSIKIMIKGVLREVGHELVLLDD